MKLRHVIGKGLLALVLCITSMIAVSRDVIAEDVTYPVKGDWITITVDNTEYRVVKQTSDGDHTYLVNSFNFVQMKWDNDDRNSNKYDGSLMQEYLGGIYNSMPDKVKNAVVEQTGLKQNAFRASTFYPYENPDYSDAITGQKNVFLLDVLEVQKYNSDNTKRIEIYQKSTPSPSDYITKWLLAKDSNSGDTVFYFRHSYGQGSIDNQYANVRNNVWDAHAAFVVDLDELAWTVKFDLNGGERDPEIEDQKIYLWTVEGGTTNDKAKKPVPDPTRDGYEFQYWYLDDEDTPFDFENTSITDDITLTAKWLGKYEYDWVNDVQTWTKGTSTGTIDLEFKRMKDGEPFHDKDSTWGSTYDWFDLFFVKDSVLDESNYSIEEGSVIVKLNSDYLNSLDAGTYDCSAQFIDEGKATCQFIVKDKVSPSPSPSPKPTVKPTPKPSKVVIQTPVAVPNTDTK